MVADWSIFKEENFKPIRAVVTIYRQRTFHVMGSHLSKSMLTWPTVIGYGAQALLAYVLYCFFLKPFLSPLRKIPGPGYNPLFGNVLEAMRGEAMQSSVSWVRKYGGIVRFYHLFGRERVLIADPAALRHIFVTNVANYERVTVNSRILGSGIFNVNGEEHAAQRRILNPHFNHEAVKYYISVFSELSNELSKFWQSSIEKQKAHVNIQEDLIRMALDVIGQCAFGYHFNCLKDPNVEISRAFRKVTGSTGISFWNLVPFSDKLPTAANKEMKQNLSVINEVVYRIIRQKRRTLSIFGTGGIKDVSDDMLGRLMVARYEDTEEGATDEELRDQVISLLLAGHETTASTLSWTLLLLAQHPDIQHRVHEELTQHPGNPSWELLNKLDYLGAVISEAQRLYPAAPSSYRRARNEDKIGGYRIPAGTLVAYHVGAMMRNPAIWSDPDDFKPERFIGRPADSSYTHLPFITGPHKCLGHQFAKIQMKTVLAVLLREFQFQPIPGTKYTRKLRVTLKAQPPIKLLVTRRENR